ncbi:MAG: hypothetical protein HYR71_03410, partial [Chloroflexi bacterium]|nr:hypothetical protein [Chloroflexota bacterium]
RNGDQFQVITTGVWSSPAAFDNIVVEHLTIELTQHIPTYHVTLIIATPFRQTLFAQYFRLDSRELAAAERQMLEPVIAPLEFAPR